MQAIPMILSDVGLSSDHLATQDPTASRNFSGLCLSATALDPQLGCMGLQGVYEELNVV